MAIIMFYLPACQLSVHGVVLIGTGKGHAAAHHGANDEHQPRQATWRKTIHYIYTYIGRQKSISYETTL